MFVALLGCESDDTTTTLRPLCPPNWGLSVTVLDSLTGAPLFENVTVVATDGAYVDTLADYAPGLKIGAWNREGVYDLHVSAPGYLEWTRASIAVTGDRCYIHTVHVEARLVRDCLPLNAAPTIEDIRDTSVVVGETLRILAAAADADGDPLRFSLQAFFNADDRFPDDFSTATIDSLTGEISYTPPEIERPLRRLRVFVRDDHCGSDSTDFIVQILERV